MRRLTESAIRRGRWSSSSRTRARSRATRSRSTLARTRRRRDAAGARVSARSRTGAIGASIERREARAKATGARAYAYEYPVDGRRLRRARAVARGARQDRLGRRIARARARRRPAVLSHENAPAPEPRRARRALPLPGAARLATTGRSSPPSSPRRSRSRARPRARRGRVRARAARRHAPPRPPGLYRPEHVAHRTRPTRVHGDVDAAFAARRSRSTRPTRRRPSTTCRWSRTPTLACWERRRADASTTRTSSRTACAARSPASFGLAPEQVRVINADVGGGFGSKGSRGRSIVLAAMAAQLDGAAGEDRADPRREMFPISGHRSPDDPADAARCGRATAAHRLGARRRRQTPALNEFCEPCTPARGHVRRAEHRFNTHRVVRLDVPSPGFCARPGEAPGFFALECALDELAGLSPSTPSSSGSATSRGDPTRARSSPAGTSSRACERAQSGSAGRRDPHPAARGPLAGRHRRRLVDVPDLPGAVDGACRRRGRGTYVVSIAAVDIGTGSRTALAQIAADELGRRRGRGRPRARRHEPSRGPIGGLARSAPPRGACGRRSPAARCASSSTSTAASPAGRARARSPTRRTRSRRRSRYSPARLRRAVRRGRRRRRHRRGARARACSASSPPGASSTPGSRARRCSAA